MTALNAERFIDEAIESILGQTYRNLELIIVDDGSTDRTRRRIRALAKRDIRIRAYRQKVNMGPSESSNFAITKARGAYIARMDADDISYPTRIQKQVDFLQKNRDVLVVGGQCDLINEHGESIGEKHFPLDHEHIRHALFTMNPIQHPSCMYRSNVFKVLNIRYEKRYFVSHDLKILFKILSFGKLANIPDTVLQYRHRPDSITHKNPKKVFGETLSIRHWALLRNRYVPTPHALIIHLLELVTVTLLPGALINQLFWLWRVQSWSMVREAFSLSFTTAGRYVLRYAPAIFFVPFFRDTK